ncbi:MAG: hypothetical protein Q4G04_04890 [bacterium]|nr:hypothetical protein [bacterium]
MKYTICYDSLSIYSNKEDAKKFYKDCYYCSEGAEQQRYASILIGLEENDQVAYDNSSSSCNDFYIHLGNYFDSPLKIQLENRLNIDEAVNYFEKNILPLLEVSNNFDIDFNKKIPFEEFGSDKENNMKSITDYYIELLKTKNIVCNSAKTEEKSDGKYNVVINDVEIGTTAWDDFNNVIDNVNIIENELKKNKEKGNNYE